MAFETMKKLIAPLVILVGGTAGVVYHFNEVARLESEAAVMRGRINYATSADRVNGGYVKDIDHDGDLDVMTRSDAGRLVALVNDGTGNLTPWVDTGSSDAPDECFRYETLTQLTGYVADPEQ